MLPQQLTKLAVLLAALSAQGSLALQILPFADSACTQGINASYNYIDYNSGDSEYFDVGGGVSSPSGPVWFLATNFHGAKTAAGGSAVNVWWSVPEQGGGCRVALMQGYSQKRYGRVGNSPIQLPGNVIINAGDPGCYYSTIAELQDLSATFCCGSGDCASLAVGNDALILKRDEGIDNALMEYDRHEVSDSTASPEMKAEEPVTRQALSPAARAAAAVQARDGTCTTTVNVGPYPAAGYQTLVANTQTCSGGTCSFTVSHGLSLSTTLTSGTDQTLTNSVGISSTVTAGFDLLVQSDVSFTASYSFAKAISKSTSTSVDNGTSVTISNNIGLAPGTTGFVTFTPTYICWDADVDCGNGVAKGLEYCNPAMSADGTTVEGDYTVVYI